MLSSTSIEKSPVKPLFGIVNSPATEPNSFSFKSNDAIF